MAERDLHLAGHRRHPDLGRSAWRRPYLYAAIGELRPDARAS